MRRLLALTVLLLSAVLRGLAQPAGDHEQIVVSFPVDKASVLPSYRDNASSLKRLDSLVNSSIRVPADTIVIVGKASMDGAERYNLALARRRAEALRNYVSAHYPYYPGVLSIQVVGEPWAELRSAVAADGGLDAGVRAQMLDIIDSDAAPDRKEARLRALPGWRGFARGLYPDYRAASVEFAAGPDPLADLVLPRDLEGADLPAPLLDLKPTSVVVPTLKGRKALRPVLAVSTNLLYDIAYVPKYGLTSIPSLSVEYYPRSYGRFSFGADVEWPMWRHWDQHRFFQIQNITLNARWYFSPRYKHDFRGPYAIASVNGFRYGIGFNATQGWEGEGLGAAVGVGYKRSLFGSRRLFWDAGVALGYFHSRYDPYVWGDDPTLRYYYDYNGLAENFVWRNHALDWLGPMRVWFSVGVDLFNRKNSGR